MKFTIFAKKRTTKEGKPFTTYLTRLKRKDGAEECVQVRFTDGFAPNQADCPLNIDVCRESANLSKKKIPTEDGEEVVSKTLWIKEYDVSEEEYVDHSLDDYE